VGASFCRRLWTCRQITEWMNEVVLLRVNEQRNILHEISKRKANWIGHILRRNCLLHGGYWRKDKRGIEVTGRRGRRSRKLLDDLKERRGYSHLKEEALDRTMWRVRFGRGFGPVVSQTAKWMAYLHCKHYCKWERRRYLKAFLGIVLWQWVMILDDFKCVSFRNYIECETTVVKA